ncbi:MUC3A protein, partial [Hylia prasina]|nr:MUC3A protein [Hylia prasina]
TPTTSTVPTTTTTTPSTTTTVPTTTTTSSTTTTVPTTTTTTPTTTSTVPTTTTTTTSTTSTVTTTTMTPTTTLTVPTTTTSSPTSTVPSTTTTITTTTKSTTTSTTRTTLTSPCQNGGTWKDGQCLCPGGFQGAFCQEATCQNGSPGVGGGHQGLSLTGSPLLGQVTINATVDMTTKVYNRNFTEELNDTSSPAYREFEATFQETMKKIYGHIKGYQSVEIQSLRNGSIVVDYKVIL